MMILYMFGFIVFLASLYGNYNLLKSNESLETELEKANEENDLLYETISNIQTQINNSNKRLEEIDSKGTFKSDDEVGYFFTELKKIQNDLNKVL